VHRITLIEGDGIGPEVVGAAALALEATGVSLEWDRREAGAATAERHGMPLPEETLASIAEHGVALKGPTATPAGSGFRSANLALRERLDLHTGIRPCRSLPGAPTRFPETDLVLVRMNHEDLYAGIELPAGGEGSERVREAIAAAGGPTPGADAGLSIKPLTAAAARRTARTAFAHARSAGRRRVTCVHKATVMRATDGVFLEAAREVAAEHPDLRFDDRLVDTMCHDLVVRPGEADVLLAPVLYGDLLSDLGAGLAGGLGLAPGASLGEDCAVFEAVHGTAPRRAGQDRANPLAMIRSGAMLLRHIGEAAAALRLEAAVAAVVAEGSTLTDDMRPRGRPAGTAAVAAAVVAALGR
jgi:isocitrate dehydrogenase (NAD+)